MHQTAAGELTSDERRFLGLVEPLGLDWLTTRAEFKHRYGHKTHAGFGEVIPLPSSTAFCAESLEFVMYDDPRVMNLPPEHLWAYFMPYNDARRNHREIEAQLVAQFGPALVDDASNCIGRVWRFGVFTVRIHTFPPEIQPREFTRPGANPFEDQNPGIRTSSRVNLDSDYALIYPDPRLAVGIPLLKAHLGKPKQPQARLLATLAHGELLYRYSDRRETRRNPSSLGNMIKTGQLVAWRDNASGYLGLSAKRDSYLFLPGPTAGLVLVHLEPARGPGGYSLYFSPDKNARLYHDTIHLLDEELHGNLLTTTQQLADTWQLPVRRETGIDD